MSHYKQTRLRKEAAAWKLTKGFCTSLFNFHYLNTGCCYCRHHHSCPPCLQLDTDAQVSPSCSLLIASAAPFPLTCSGPVCMATCCRQRHGPFASSKERHRSKNPYAAGTCTALPCRQPNAMGDRFVCFSRHHLEVRFWAESGL